MAGHFKTVPGENVGTLNKKATFSFDSNGLIFFYNWMMGPRKFELPPHLFPIAMALMDFRINKLMITVGPGSGKSTLTSVVFPAFLLGNDPTMTVLGVSAGEALMQGFMRAVGEWIEADPRWKIAFPNVRPDKNGGWSTERGLYVTGRNKADPDASYFACGINSAALTGKHGRTVLVDDIHNRENAGSALQCMNVRDTWYKTLQGRADPRGARFVVTGRRWRPDDLYGHLMEMGDFVVMELPAEREDSGGQLYWSLTVPDGLDCCFTDGTIAVDIERNPR